MRDTGDNVNVKDWNGNSIGTCRLLVHDGRPWAPGASRQVTSVDYADGVTHYVNANDGDQLHVFRDGATIIIGRGPDVRYHGHLRADVTRLRFNGGVLALGAHQQAATHRARVVAQVAAAARASVGTPAHL